MFQITANENRTIRYCSVQEPLSEHSDRNSRFSIQNKEINGRKTGYVEAAAGN